jgi:hypothetical protein
MSEVQFEKFDTLYELRVKYPQGKDGLVMVAGVLRKWDAGSKDWVVYVDDVKGDYRLYDFIGDGIVRGDLHVAGKLRAYDVEPACKGLFKTEEDLKDSYERGRKGDWACVGKEAPYLIYIWDRYWKRTEASWSPEVSLNPYATLEDLAAEADTRKQADDSLAQDIADLNNNDVLIANDIATLKERNNAEIPAYSGVVASATIKGGSFTQYSGVYFIKSEGRFAVKVGNEYFDNCLAYGDYQAQQVYHQDDKAVPNRLYNLIASSGGGLHYFDGTSFKVVNDNADVVKTIATLRGVMGGNAQVIEWSATHNMNNYKTAGTYRITGERTNIADNLPIGNANPGHTIDGVLYVLNSSLPNGGVNQYDKCVTQFLMLSNRVGGQEGDMYMRSGYGLYDRDDSFTWKPWEKFQTNIEVGYVSDDAKRDPSSLNLIDVGGLNSLVDNGIYSGVYITEEAFGDLTKVQTFVMVVINNYAAAGDNKTITQIKFAVTNAGGYSMERRSRGYDGKWSGWINEYNDLSTRMDEAESRIGAAEGNIDLNTAQINELKERNNAEIPTFTGVVDSAEYVFDQSATQFLGVYYIKSRKVFAALNGDIYYTSWQAQGMFQSSKCYNQNGVAVENRIYYRKGMFDTGNAPSLVFLKSGSFVEVNDNDEIEDLQTRVTTLEDNAVTIVNDLTTGGEDKALSAEMGKELQKNLREEVLGVKLANLEIGTYYPDTNTYDDALRTRVRTTIDSYFHLKKGDVISLSDFSVAKLRIARFIDEVYTDYTTWLTKDYICPSDGEYKLCIMSVPEVVQTDVSTLADLLIINTTSSLDNVRENVSRLDEDVENIKIDIGGKALVDLLPITTYGEYIDNNIIGNTYKNDLWAYAAPIYLRKGCTINVKTQGYGIEVIASCDSEGSTDSFESLVRPATSSGLTEYKYTAQSDMYVAVSFKYALNDTEVSIQGEEIMKKKDIQLIERDILSIQGDTGALLKKVYGGYNITNEFTLYSGQAYGSVGSNINTSPSDNRYQHTYLTDVKNRSISVTVPYTSSPSSLVQYVDSNGKITRLFGVGYTDGQVFDFVLPPFDNGESGVYVTSATGYLSIFEVNTKSDSLFEKFTSQTRLGNNTLITSHLCAHRGLAGSSREIRYSDLELCYNAGFKRIETDLASSSDGVIYCSHNGYVNGTHIPNMTSEQVDSAVSGDNRVLKLEEVILFCKTHDIILEMDMASTTRLIDDYVGNVVDLVRMYNAFSTCIFVAFKSRIQNIYNLANNIMVCISSGATSEDSDTRTDEQVKNALDNCISSMTPMYREVSMAYGTTGQNITKERVTYAHKLGFAVKVYLTTDDASGASFDTKEVMNELFNMGVDCMLTDTLIPNEVSDGLIYLLARKVNETI